MDPLERKTAIGLANDEIADVAPHDDEPTEEEFRASVRRSMRQALAGETRPADEALEDIRRELAGYADASGPLNTLISK